MINCCFTNSKKIMPRSSIDIEEYPKKINIVIDQQILNQLNDYNMIGDGYSSKVYKCRSSINKKYYACKCIYKRYTRDALNEIKILKSFTSFNYLPKLIDFKENSVSFFILMEYIRGRELFYLLDESCSLKKILNITYQILLGIAELQEHNIFHLDLKLENIIINSHNNVKILDFGLSEKAVYKKNNSYYVILKSLCGTLGYYSPEALLTLAVTEKTDLWNVGIILWMLLTKFPPFTIVPKQAYGFEIKNLELFHPLIKHNIEFHNEEYLSLIDDKKVMYTDFINHTICNVKDRYSIYKLLNHDIFNDVKNNY